MSLGFIVLSVIVEIDRQKQWVNRDFNLITLHVYGLYIDLFSIDSTIITTKIIMIIITIIRRYFAWWPYFISLYCKSLQHENNLRSFCWYFFADWIDRIRLMMKIEVNRTMNKIEVWRNVLHNWQWKKSIYKVFFMFFSWFSGFCMAILANTWN